MLGLLSRFPRHSRTVSDGDAPVVPTGAVSYYGKLDVRGAFVTGHTAIWKYNMHAHIWESHPGYNVDAAIGLGEFHKSMTLPDELIALIFISDQEEERIKIPKDKIPLKLILKTQNNEVADARSGQKKRKLDSITNLTHAKR